MNKENFYVLAINHKATEIQNIGDFTIGEESYDNVIKSLLNLEGIDEVVYLSTCNRVEVWVYTNGKVDKNQIVNQVFKGDCFGRFFNLQKDFFELNADLALLHMINVACSLDSMVVGEREIFGQLRKAFIKAKDAGAVGKNLNLAFRKITEISKAVYSQTEIANQKISVASIACHELRKLINEVEKTNVTLIGAGETIQLVSKYLVNHSFKSVSLFNRTIKNADKVAQIISRLQIKDFKGLKSGLEESDVVITCTGANEPIITKEKIFPNKHYTILDLAVPSDTCPEVQIMNNVHFIGVDELKEIAQQNLMGRLKDLNNASKIAHAGWEELIEFLQEREVVHKTKEVHSAIDEIFEDKFIIDQMVFLNKEDKVITERMFRYIKKKLNRMPAKISKEILIQKNA